MPEILLTGFQPYGGRQLNPSAEVVRALDGTRIGGFQFAACCFRSPSRRQISR